MAKSDTAKKYFLNGCNCSQAVAAAFSDEMGMKSDTVKKLTIGFGGGIGRMREVCGCVCAMAFVISALYNEEKGEIYKRVQTVAKKFEAENGSIVCRELLGISKPGADSPTPSPRTKEYYKKRPCPELVEQAAQILENYIKDNPY